jgi:hypothetical protein
VALLGPLTQPIEGQAEVQHVDRLLAEQAQLTIVGVGRDHMKHGRQWQPALAGDDRWLVVSIGDRGVRIEPRARRRDGVDGNEIIGTEAVRSR